MTTAFKDQLEPYLAAADSWQRDRGEGQRKSLKIAWTMVGILALVALAEAFALAMLSPLKTAVPYTLLVDKQTGYVEILKPLETQSVAPDAALTRSLLAQYVLTREGFDIDSLQADYRKVALWSAGEARDQYIARMQATNPSSPLASLPRRALVNVVVRSVSSLSSGTSLVRFSTARGDQGDQSNPQLWAAVVTYRFSTKAMTAADRMSNPLGFQVTRYRRDAETAPEPTPITRCPFPNSPDCNSPLMPLKPGMQSPTQNPGLRSSPASIGGAGKRP